MGSNEPRVPEPNGLRKREKHYPKPSPNHPPTSGKSSTDHEVEDIISKMVLAQLWNVEDDLAQEQCEKDIVLMFDELEVSYSEHVERCVELRKRHR